MPDYEIKDPVTGRTRILQSDRPLSDAELDEAARTFFPKTKPTKPYPRTGGMLRETEGRESLEAQQKKNRQAILKPPKSGGQAVSPPPEAWKRPQLKTVQPKSIVDTIRDFAGNWFAEADIRDSLLGEFGSQSILPYATGVKAALQARRGDTKGAAVTMRQQNQVVPRSSGGGAFSRSFGRGVATGVPSMAVGSAVGRGVTLATGNPIAGAVAGVAAPFALPYIGLDPNQIVDAFNKRLIGPEAFAVLQELEKQDRERHKMATVMGEVGSNLATGGVTDPLEFLSDARLAGSILRPGGLARATQAAGGRSQLIQQGAGTGVRAVTGALPGAMEAAKEKEEGKFDPYALLGAGLGGITLSGQGKFGTAISRTGEAVANAPGKVAANYRTKLDRAHRLGKSGGAPPGPPPFGPQPAPPGGPIGPTPVSPTGPGTERPDVTFRTNTDKITPNMGDTVQWQGTPGVVIGQSRGSTTLSVTGKPVTNPDRVKVAFDDGTTKWIPVTHVGLKIAPGNRTPQMPSPTSQGQTATAETTTAATGGTATQPATTPTPTSTTTSPSTEKKPGWINRYPATTPEDAATRIEAARNLEPTEAHAKAKLPLPGEWVQMGRGKAKGQAGVVVDKQPDGTLTILMPDGNHIRVAGANVVRTAKVREAGEARKRAANAQQDIVTTEKTPTEAEATTEAGNVDNAPATAGTTVVGTGRNRRQATTGRREVARGVVPSRGTPKRVIVGKKPVKPATTPEPEVAATPEATTPEPEVAATPETPAATPAVANATDPKPGDRFNNPKRADVGVEVVKVTPTHVQYRMLGNDANGNPLTEERRQTRGAFAKQWNTPIGPTPETTETTTPSEPTPPATPAPVVAPPGPKPKVVAPPGPPTQTKPVPRKALTSSTAQSQSYARHPEHGTVLIKGVEKGMVTATKLNGEEVTFKANEAYREEYTEPDASEAGGNRVSEYTQTFGNGTTKTLTVEEYPVPKQGTDKTGVIISNAKFKVTAPDGSTYELSQMPKNTVETNVINEGGEAIDKGVIRTRMEDRYAYFALMNKRRAGGLEPDEQRILENLDKTYPNLLADYHKNWKNVTRTMNEDKEAVQRASERQKEDVLDVDVATGPIGPPSKEFEGVDDAELSRRFDKASKTTAKGKATREAIRSEMLARAAQEEAKAKQTLEGMGGTGKEKTISELDPPPLHGTKKEWTDWYDNRIKHMTEAEQVDVGERSLKEGRKMVDNLTKSADMLEDRINTLVPKIADYEKQLARATRQIVTARAEVKKQQTNLRHPALPESMREAISDRLQDAQDQLDSVEAAAKSLKADIDSGKRIISNYQVAIKNYRASASGLEVHNKNLQDHIEKNLYYQLGQEVAAGGTQEGVVLSGKAEIQRGVMEYRGVDQDVKDAAIEFMNLFPDKYWQQMSLSFQKHTRYVRLNAAGKPQITRAYHDPIDAVIYFSRLSALSGDLSGDLSTTLPHEFGHYLHRLIPHDDFWKLGQYFLKNKDKLGEPFKKQGYTEDQWFYEWFTEMIRKHAAVDTKRNFDTGLKDVPLSVSNAINTYRRLANGISDFFVRRGKGDIGRMVYLNLVEGKYSGELHGADSSAKIVPREQLLTSQGGMYNRTMADRGIKMVPPDWATEQYYIPAGGYVGPPGPKGTPYNPSQIDPSRIDLRGAADATDKVARALALRIRAGGIKGRDAALDYLKQQGVTASKVVDDIYNKALDMAVNLKLGREEAAKRAVTPIGPTSGPGSATGGPRPPMATGAAATAPLSPTFPARDYTSAPEDRAELAGALKSAREANVTNKEAIRQQRGVRATDLDNIARTEKNPMTRYYKMMDSLRGQYTKPGASNIPKITHDSLMKLFNDIENTPNVGRWDKLNATKALHDFAEGRAIPGNYSIKVLKTVFGKEFADAIGSELAAGTVRPEGSWWRRLLNTQRAIRSSHDIGTPFRQTILHTVNHPIEAIGFVKDALTIARSNQRHDEWVDNLITSPVVHSARDDGIHIADVASVDGTQVSKEEHYAAETMLRLYEDRDAKGAGPIGTVLGGGKGPLGTLARGVLASERVHNVYLTKVRLAEYDRMTRILQKGGVDRNTPEGKKTFEAMATMVNTMTGRGSLAGYETAGNILGDFFFAPRFRVSRFALANPGYLVRLYKQNPALARKVAQDQGTLLTVAGLIAGAAKIAEKMYPEWGVSFGIDPADSKSFGRLRIGNTAYSAGGIDRYYRMFHRLTWSPVMTPDGEKRLVPGSLRNRLSPAQKVWAASLLNDGAVKTASYRQSMVAEAGKDLKYGFSPAASMAYAGLAEHDVVGKPLTTLPEWAWFGFANSFLPITFENVAEAGYKGYQEAGPIGALKGAAKVLPEAIGISTLDVSPRPPKGVVRGRGSQRRPDRSRVRQ